MRATKQEWKYSNPNYVLESDGFFLSYNPGHYIFGRSDTGGPETAIVLEDSQEANPFWILDGDHRKAYERVFPDRDACIDYFEANRSKYQSCWSNDSPVPRKVAKT